MLKFIAFLLLLSLADSIHSAPENVAGVMNPCVSNTCKQPAGLADVHQLEDPSSLPEVPLKPVPQQVRPVQHVPIKLPLFTSLLVHDKQEADTCAASTSSGLTNLIRQAKSLLPLAEIQQLIADSVANDPQVRTLLALGQLDSVRGLVSAIRQTSQYRALLDYTCQMLQVDPQAVWNFVRPLVMLTSQVQPTPGEFKGRPGIRGLLQDIRSTLPRQQLKDLYQHLMEKDSKLSESVQRLQSSEFRQLLHKLRGVAEYQEVREMLLNAGVPLQGLKELIVVALGWDGAGELSQSGEQI